MSAWDPTRVPSSHRTTRNTGMGYSKPAVHQSVGARVHDGKGQVSVTLSVALVCVVDLLPDEVLLQVFGFVPACVLILKTRLVCKRWNRLSFDQSLCRLHLNVDLSKLNWHYWFLPMYNSKARQMCELPTHWSMLKLLYKEARVSLTAEERKKLHFAPSLTHGIRSFTVRHFSSNDQTLGVKELATNIRLLKNCIPRGQVLSHVIVNVCRGDTQRGLDLLRRIVSQAASAGASPAPGRGTLSVTGETTAARQTAVYGWLDEVAGDRGRHPRKPVEGEYVSSICIRPWQYWERLLEQCMSSHSLPWPFTYYGYSKPLSIAGYGLYVTEEKVTHRPTINAARKKHDNPSLLPTPLVDPNDGARYHPFLSSMVLTNTVSLETMIRFTRVFRKRQKKKYKTNSLQVQQQA